MVTKKSNTIDRKEMKGAVKVGKLQLNKETVRDLTDEDLKKVKGGLVVTAIIAVAPPALLVPALTGYCPVKK